MSEVTFLTNKDKTDIVQEVRDILKSEEVLPYTNLIPLSLDASGEIPYGENGYKENWKWSESQQLESSNAGTYITGYIPVTVGETLYFKNINFKNNSEDKILWVSTLGASIGSSHGTFLDSKGVVSWGSDGNAKSIKLASSVFKPEVNYNYIRIQCYGINSASIISKEEIPEDDIESRISTLEVSSSDIKERISELESNNSNDDDIKIPSYWVSALEEGAKTINAALCEAGRNKSAFLFYSDAHWNYGSQMSPTLLKYLYNHTGINKTFFGGDIVNNESTDYDTMSYLWEWRRQLKDLPNHHSVVGNHDDGNGENNNMFSENYIYGYLLAAEETPDIIRGDEGLYYYIDNPAEKTRYILLDTAYKGMTPNQQEFLKEALVGTKKGWHIVVISHIWYEPDYDQYNVRPIPIKGLSNDASIVVSMLDAYNSRLEDYANCEGKVEFCIGGHAHIDYTSTTAGGIPIILVETDSNHTRGSYTYVAETSTESSVNGIITDYDNNKIHIVRIGRGESRDIDSFSGEIVRYFNINVTTEYCTGVSANSIKIKQDGTETLKFTANDNCELPESISVQGATYTWNKDTGELILNNPTETVIIKIVAITNNPVALYKNLFVASEATSGQRINSNGTFTESVDDITTGFIQVQPNTSYTIRCRNLTNSNNSVISRLAQYSDANENSHVLQYRCSELDERFWENYDFCFPFTTESNVNYIRVCVIGAANCDLIITLNEPIVE